ncbi:MAG: zinc-ribbon domain containing protein [Acidobacteriota bacterium]
MIEYRDKVIKCVECNQEFTFTAGEQLFFADKGLRNEPKRCKTCKAKKNERFSAMLGERPVVPQRSRAEVAVTCAQCGVNTTVPFLPTQNRPVYCRECFVKMRATQGVQASVTIG